MAKVTVTTNGYSIESLYKWDTGQVLEIHGLALSITPQVHFAHEGAALAIVRQASMDTAGVIRASIPDSLLQSSARLCAYVCTEQGEEFKTLYKIVIPVITRAKPNDYAPDEEAYVYALANTDMEIVTLEAGSAAKVEKVMVGDTVTLRFSIPQGPKGADGTVAFENLTDAQRESLRGPQGIQGETGNDGVTFIPSVDSDGNLSWSNDAGAANPATVNIMGPQGPKGADGTMTFADLTDEQKESLRGPAGADGEDGQDGSNGVTFTPSVDSEGNLSWSNDAGATNPATVNIKGPAGADGAAGSNGADGYTPVRGTDYWTEADIAEIKAYVDDAILNGAW